ncbi:MAG: hypothetical protein KC621_19035 [Myxococcales bacterium]|nr:hypothetical protein [Myxococcales bacterium]
MQGDQDLGVPPHHREAAEEVRAHLCSLRGGGLFLSPMDSLKLVQWLDRGVRVGDIVVALERAAAARRTKRSRLPLTLGAASRHLGKAGHSAAPRRAEEAEPALAPLVPGVDGDPAVREAASRLAAVLHGIDPDDAHAETHALAAIRVFLDEVWALLGEAGRLELHDRAREELGDLLHLVDEPTALALVEETARDLLRQRWPALTAASVRDLLGVRGTGAS